jgi:hypothetical protein
MGLDSATMGDEAEEAGNLTGAGQRLHILRTHTPPQIFGEHSLNGDGRAGTESHHARV